MSQSEQEQRELYIKVLEKGRCAQCRKITPQLLMLMCDHKLCRPCSACLTKCPDCDAELDPEYFTPDLVIEALLTYLNVIVNAEPEDPKNELPHKTPVKTKGFGTQTPTKRPKHSIEPKSNEKDNVKQSSKKKTPKKDDQVHSSKSSARVETKSRAKTPLLDDRTQVTHDEKNSSNKKLKKDDQVQSFNSSARVETKHCAKSPLFDDRKQVTHDEKHSSNKKLKKDDQVQRSTSSDRVERKPRAKTPLLDDRKQVTHDEKRLSNKNTPKKDDQVHSSTSSARVETTPVPSTSNSRRPSTPFADGKTPKIKRNMKGETALHQYCSKGYKKDRKFSLETLQVMIAFGANPNTRDGSGITPLHESIYYDNLEIVKVLLDGGALVNGYREAPVWTPLHEAVARHITASVTKDSTPYKIITTLLDYGADKTLKDCYGKTPVDIASSNPQMLDLLETYKPKKLSRIQLLALEPPMLVMSGLQKKSDDDTVKKFCNHFKIKFLSNSRSFGPEVSHLVVPNDTNKANFLIRSAILCGAYVVNFKWIKDSLRENYVLPAEDYEIRGPLSPNHHAEYVSRQARLDRLKMKPKLFAGAVIHISSCIQQAMSSKYKERVQALAELGGGRILTREPKPADITSTDTKIFHAPVGSAFEKCSALILYSRPPYPMYNMDHIKQVPLPWFFDCIDSYSILDL